MKQQTIEYTDGAHTLLGQLFMDEQSTQKRPGIIIFPAFEGLSQFALDYANKLASLGYVVLAADMYGEGKTSDTLEGCFSLMAPFAQDRALVRRRACLAFDVLSSHEFVDAQHIGAMGFCFGGMCALEVARSGIGLRAVVSAHGVLSKSNLPSQPIQSSILVLHGYQDPQVPPASLASFAEEMSSQHVSDWRFLFFGHAKHSFTDPKTGQFEPEKEKEIGREYHQIAAEATWRYAIDFFGEKLFLSI